MIGGFPYYGGVGCFRTFAIQNFPFIEGDFDALTDYQLMQKIFKYLDDEIKKVDNKYAGIYDTVSQLEADFETFKTEVNAELTKFKNQILSDVEKLNEQQYARVTELLSNYQIIFEAYVNTQIATVNERIDDIEVGAVNIYNPLTGFIEPVGKVIDDMYNSLRYNAITCTEYDELELTATTYDGYMITAQNFDLNAKSILI